MKKVKDITRTITEIERMGYGVENEIIEKIDVNIIGHFGNIPCLTILCSKISPYGTCNDIARLGFLIKYIVKFFGVGRDNGVMLSQLKNIPCRIVYDGQSESHWGEKAVGIGHFMLDKFILFEDFAKLYEYEMESKGAK